MALSSVSAASLLVTNLEKLSNEGLWKVAIVKQLFPRITILN